MTRVLILALVAVVAGCATGTRKPAPVSERAASDARTVKPAATAPSAAAVPATPTAPPAAKPAAKPAEPARAETYTVKPGDTLYAIALDHGLDYRDIAAWNNLDNVNVIRVGQQLRLTPPGPAPGATAAVKPRGEGIEGRPLDAPTDKPEAKPPVAATAAPTSPVPANTAKLRTGPRAARVPYSDAAWAQANRADAPPTVARADAKPDVKPESKPEMKPEAKAPEPKPDPVLGAGDWGWPTAGKVIGQFNGNTLKGVDIAGKAGQPVVAAAPGRVIFSGTGIRGLGKFVVIKHNNEFISVYGHNSELAVKQDQMVTRGQKIAEMGNTDTDQVKLHFQIRRLGTPVDPLKLLPEPRP